MTHIHIRTYSLSHPYHCERIKCTGSNGSNGTREEKPNVKNNKLEIWYYDKWSCHPFWINRCDFASARSFSFSISCCLLPMPFSRLPSLFSHHKTLFSYKRIDKDTTTRSISLHTHALNINIISSSACLLVYVRFVKSLSIFIPIHFTSQLLSRFIALLFTLAADEGDSGGGVDEMLLKNLSIRFM